MRVVKPWHRLPREVGDVPSLETFQGRLDGALSTLLQLEMSLLIAGWVDEMAFKGPFQPKPFHDSESCFSPEQFLEIALITLFYAFHCTLPLQVAELPF